MPKQTFLNLPEAKRALIVRIALEEFASHPFRQASLSRIVARAGIAKGSMYQYFEDKLDLYRWLLQEEVAKRDRAQLQQVVADDSDDFFSVLGDIFLARLNFIVKHPLLARLIASAVASAGEPELRQIQTEMYQGEHAWMAQQVQQAQAAGRVRSDLSPEIVAHLIIGVTKKGLFDALLGYLGTDPHGLLSHPERVQRITEEELRELVHEGIEFLRHGLATPAKPPTPAMNHRMPAM